MTAANTVESAMTPLGFIALGFLLEKMTVWILTGLCGIRILFPIRKRTLIQLFREADQPAGKVTAPV
ncbi:hypothetical protein [Cytobacillus oceanisediminis]|uniref:Uncharacterized protein n=1 Tax=Cytobacillus oceanisediminis TaxID=665099 RepID=A0A562JWU2_9BACI|nr:hypothetical protein [Cytobacillus oceanisediminis]TWH87629.1 hypothetical protein IQ19_01871 [Cytobacillus oceanisediminis]